MTRKKIYGLTALCIFAATMLFPGCIKEQRTGSTANGDPVDISVKVPTRSVNWKEGDGIDDIRIIIWEIGDGRVVHNEEYLPADFTPDATPGNNVYGTLQLTLAPDIYGILVFANQKEYRAALAGVTSHNDLAALRVSQIIGTGENVGDYPAGTIKPESKFFPFPRICHLPRVHVGNNMTTETNKQVSIDGGATWLENLPIALEYSSAKINISLRKMTGTGTDGSHVNDRFYITALRLLHVPNYAYMISAPYTGTEYNSMQWYQWKEGDARDNNDYFIDNNNGDVSNAPGDPGYDSNLPETFSYQGGIYIRSNHRDIAIPEYIMADNTLVEQSVVLEVHADYEKWNPALNDGAGGYDDVLEDVWSIVPLYTDEIAGVRTYNMLRNKEYHVLLTLTQIENFNFTPQVTLLASDWDQSAEGNFNAGNENVSLTGSWVTGSPNSENEIYVGTNSTVAYKFAFQRPGGDNSIIRWNAVLSNPVDFKLAGTTGGYARPGDEITVEVGPVAASHVRNATKLYINIEDGVGGVIKLGLDRDYTIYQTPQ